MFPEETGSWRLTEMSAKLFPHCSRQSSACGSNLVADLDSCVENGSWLSWRRWTNDLEMKKGIILVVWLVFEVRSCVVQMWVCSQHAIQSSWSFWNSDMFLQKMCFFFFFFAFLNTFDGWVMQLSRSYLPWWYCTRFCISLALSIGSSLLLGVLTRPESCSELGRRAGGWKVLLTSPPLADLGPSLHPSLQHQAAGDSCRCFSQTSLFPTPSVRYC